MIESARKTSRERGLTMIELVMFIVIVSVAIVGILQVLNLTTQRSVDPQLRKQALSIAEALLEEVQLAGFTFCDPRDDTAETATAAVIGVTGCTAILENVGPEAGNTRPFDNVNDYVNAYGIPAPYTTDAKLDPINVNGIYNATVTITPTVLPAASSFAAIPANSSLLISVRVGYNNDSDSVTLEGFRTRYAPNP